MKNMKLFCAVVGLVVILSGAIAVFYDTKNMVENNKKAVIEYKGNISTIKEDMNAVKIDIRDVKRIVKEDKKHAEAKDKAQIKNIKTALAEVLQTQTKKRRR